MPAKENVHKCVFNANVIKTKINMQKLCCKKLKT